MTVCYSLPRPRLRPAPHRSVCNPTPSLARVFAPEYFRSHRLTTLDLPCNLAIPTDSPATFALPPSSFSLSFLSPFPLGAAQCSEGQPCACEVCRSGSQRFRCSSGMIPSAITHCCTPQTDHFWASRGAIAGSGHEVKHEFLNITRNVGA